MKKIPLIIFLTIVIVFCSIPAFADESSDFTIENGVLTSYDGPGGDVVIPDGVISIDWNAFDNKSNLKSVAFPSSVTSVHPDTFCFHRELMKFVVDPQNTTYSVTDGVLYSKDKTTLVACHGGKTGHFSIPKGVKVIGTNAFVACDKLSSIIIPDSVTTISDLAFQSCFVLPEITIPNSVTSIGDHAFMNCLKLSNILIPRSVTSIGEDAFFTTDGNIVTISGYNGSSAQTYAEKNNIPFKSLDTKPTSATVRSSSAAISKLSSSTAPVNSSNIGRVISSSNIPPAGTESQISSESSESVTSAVSSTATRIGTGGSLWIMILLLIVGIIIVIIIYITRKKKHTPTLPSQNTASLHCPNCNADCEAGAKFCEQCGQSIKDVSLPKSRICAKCGFENDLGAKFCMGCGNKLNKD